MAKGRRAVPEGFVRIIERRRSGAAGTHQGSTETRSAERRGAISSSIKES